MNRRDFFRRAGLIVAGVIAVPSLGTTAPASTAVDGWTSATAYAPGDVVRVPIAPGNYRLARTLEVSDLDGWMFGSYEEHG